MKICFIVEHFPPHVGGVEIVFYEYAKRLTQKGHQIRVVTSNSGGIVGKKRMKGFEVYYLRSFSFFSHPIISKKKALLHAHWADIIHTTTYTAALTANRLSKKLDKPCLITVHEALGKKWKKIEENPIKAFLFRFFEKFVIKRQYTKWHAISKATKQELLDLNIHKEKIETIYHGIDKKIWNPQVRKINLNKIFHFDKNDRIFLYTGRPGQTKGLNVLLKAIKKLKNKLPANFKFGFILSKDPLKERIKLKKSIQENNLQNIIHIINSVPYNNLPCYRKSAHAVIVPSITEGFGFVAAETCAIETPLISSNAGALPEVIGGKALFFENKNEKDLAKKILLATQNKFKNHLKKNFDWNNSITKIEKVYKEIIEKR
jgi:glycosyltransferase involved in cell wall biosynthesis